LAVVDILRGDAAAAVRDAKKEAEPTRGPLVQAMAQQVGPDHQTADATRHAYTASTARSTLTTWPTCTACASMQISRSSGCSEPGRKATHNWPDSAYRSLCACLTTWPALCHPVQAIGAAAAEAGVAKRQRHGLHQLNWVLTPCWFSEVLLATVVGTSPVPRRGQTISRMRRCRLYAEGRLLGSAIEAANVSKWPLGDLSVHESRRDPFQTFRRVCYGEATSPLPTCTVIC